MPNIFGEGCKIFFIELQGCGKILKVHSHLLCRIHKRPTATLFFWKCFSRKSKKFSRWLIDKYLTNQPDVGWLGEWGQCGGWWRSLWVGIYQVGSFLYFYISHFYTLYQISFFIVYQVFHMCIIDICSKVWWKINMKDLTDTPLSSPPPPSPYLAIPH